MKVEQKGHIGFLHSLGKCKSVGVVLTRGWVSVLRWVNEEAHAYCVPSLFLDVLYKVCYRCSVLVEPLVTSLFIDRNHAEVAAYKTVLRESAIDN